MERLVDGLGKATSGNGCCIGICGPAGVGKTYLLRKLEKTAGGLGFSVLKSSCEPGAGPKEVFSTLLTYSSSSVTDMEHPLFLLELLETLSNVGPVLLTIEDIHFAETPVISVLILMARNLGERRVMIAFTYDCDKVDTSYGDVHPLVDGLRILTREGKYEEIKLHAMSRPSLLELVEDDVRGQIDPSLADLLWERSEGNPMVAVEAIRLLIQSKMVHKIGGVWRPVGPLSLDLPDNYRAMLESRLGMLAAEDIELLTLAAVAGRSFDPWVIAKVQDRKPLEVLEQLDRLAHDHHILEEDCERYRFSSNGIRSVILDSITEKRKKD
ncbi:MAG: ATP-binding protein, partial [Candidatus Saccharibacteria bacterium]